MNIETILISEGNTFNNVCTGNINDDILTFVENGIEVKYDLKKDQLNRKSDAFEMDYKFILNEETENQIFIKDIEKSVIIKIQTLNLIKTECLIDITYKLVDDDNVIRYTINYGG